MFVVCSIVMWCICAARRRIRGATDNSEMLPVASEVKLRTVLFNSDLSAYVVTSCVICLGEYSVRSFEAGAEVTKTPCDHVFHAVCLQQWIQIDKRACPMYTLDRCGSNSLEGLVSTLNSPQSKQ